MNLESVKARAQSVRNACESLKALRAETAGKANEKPSPGAQ